jgi:membrane protein insertase Oxa1/YidC/SpoIIIJ
MKLNQEMMALYKAEKVNPAGWLFACAIADSGVFRAL